MNLRSLTCCLLLAVLAGAVAVPTALADSPLAGKVKKIDGTEIDLADYKGKVVVIVNVASQCGATPQYAGLQKLYDTTLPEGSVDVVYSAFRYASGQVAGAAPPKVGHVDTSTFMHHWSALKHGSWLPDGYTCDGQFVERLVAAGCRWAFQTEPTVTLQGPNFGAPDRL